MRTGAKIFIISMVSVLFCASLSLARDTRHMFSIKHALEHPEAKAKLNQGVKFYFGDQAHPEVVQSFGTFTSNRKTNAFGKSDLEACEWAFLGGLVALQERALREGGDAVINIKSYYKKHEISSEDQYECGAGNVIAGVALRGSVVKLGGVAGKRREDEY